MIDANTLTNLVEQALIEGATRTIVELSIDEYCEREKQPRPTAQQIDAAYAACIERWQADALADAALYAWHVRVRKHLYQAAIASDDYKGAHAIAKDLAELQQQYKRERATEQRRSDRAAILRSIRGGKS